MPPKPEAETDAAPAKPTLGQRFKLLPGALRALLGRLAAQRWRLVIAAVVGVVVIVGVVVGSLVMRSPSAAPPPPSLDTILAALDNQSYVRARELALRLQADPSLPPAEQGGPAFVLGAVTVYEAEDMGPKARATLCLAAARWLETARDRGFPSGRRPEGMYLLGKSLWASRQFVASRPVLREALKLNPERAVELNYLLADACRRGPQPELPQALQYNAAYLAEPLASDDHIDGLVQRAAILFHQGKSAACAAAIDELPPAGRKMSEPLLLRGQLLLDEARAAAKAAATDESAKQSVAEKYQAAIKTLRLAESRDTLGGDVSSKAMYLLGVGFAESGDVQAALAQFERMRKAQPDTPEAFAAAIAQADLLRREHKDADAVVLYRHALAGFSPSAESPNPWVSTEELKTRLLSVCQQYVRNEQYELAVNLARAIAPLAGSVKSGELAAETLQTWGQSLLLKAERQPWPKSDAVRQQARKVFRAAGQTFARLAANHLASRQYTDYVWQSATGYFQGQDYHNAVRMTREYLKYETRRRNPQALVMLGESLLALDRINEALRALQECIEFYPRDAAAYRARLVASRACWEKGETAQSETLLRDNLTGEFLTPASTEWRESLFALANLLHETRRWGEAVTRLDEALQRYPDARQSLTARYLLADSYQQLANAAADKLQRDLPAGGAQELPLPVRSNLEKSLDQYRQLQHALARRQESESLTPAEQAMLRNAQFAEGGILSELGQYDEAARMLLGVVNRYQQTPTALSAYVQIVDIYRRQGKSAEARTALAQAKLVLARLKPDAPFQETTNYSRPQWGDVLATLEQL